MTPEGVRAAAARVLDRALDGRRPADRLLDAAAAGRSARDAALLRELVLGTLRWLRRLDAVIAAAAGRPLGRIDRRLLAPLRLGAYQLLFLDRVPAHAAVDRAVAEAKRRTHRGAAGFVNAVLRRIAERPALAEWPLRESDPVRRLAVETSHPDLLVERWWKRFGESATRTLLDADNLRPEIHLLAFEDRGGRDALATSLAGEGVATSPAPLSPVGLLVEGGDPLTSTAFARGDCYLQNQASQAAALLPPPGAGERILDAAAAPGGKSFALLAVEPRLRLVAGDLSPRRLATLTENLGRLRRTLPRVVLDAAAPPTGEAFDRVVVDLPCSGTGTLRQHPELKWRLSAAELGRLAGRGLEMLLGAAKQVRPGGLLVAITCSLEREENEEVFDALLARRPDYRPLPLAGRLEPALAAGLFDEGRWRLLTGPRNDGFTVQVAERRRGRLVASGRDGRGRAAPGGGAAPPPPRGPR
ncbi:MAG: transcription antitermination factor NusB [Thermoanaerobaculia bacterium]|nr:transcription antitermination factor NusB [Thermoanaerobaculia bacterium]